MKVKSVAGLAALGMFLSSVTVWSVTQPRGATDPLAAEPDPAMLAQGPLSQGPLAVDFAGAAFTAGHTLMLEGRVGHPKLLRDKDNETLLLLNVTADSTDVGATAAPLNLSIVIDRSGSMKGKRLQNALDGARGMVRRMRDGDVVSVVTYNQTAETVLAPTRVDSFSRDRVLSSLSSISAQGDTCISCGIDEGMAQLRRQSGMVDRILLLSDGEATAGVRDPEGFRAVGARIRSMGASISSVGVDVEYNERVMNTLAIESNGRHYFVESAGDLPRVFDQELENLVKSVAKNADVSVDLAPGVEVVRVFDRTFRRDGRRLVVPLGSFSSGEEKTLLVSVRVPRGANGERPVADVRMTYDDLSTGSGFGSRGEVEGKLSVLLLDDPSQVSSLDPFVSTRMVRSETAAALTDANQLFSAGRSDEARRKLSDKLDSLKRRQAETLARAPARAKPKLKADFEKQTAALGEATDGFSASPAPAAGAAPATGADKRKGQAQVRKNSVKALDMAF